MRRRTRGLVVACCASLALGSAAAVAVPARAQDAPYSDWNAGYEGFPSNIERNAAADCVAGGRTCIDRTIFEMFRRFHTVIPGCDHNAVFSLTYIRVTENIRDLIDQGFYPDRRWIDHLDAIFARIYFVAYDNWSAGRRALVPPAWRTAFDTARAKGVSGIGNLLLAMNAHINRDFAFVLYHAGLVDAAGRSRKREHDDYNAKLRELYRPMLTELAHRFDATIDDYDAPGTEFDDDAIFQVLVGWREAAWRNAERLAAAGSDAERRAIAWDIERQAESQAQFIHANTAYKPGDDRTSREARCARFGGQDPAGWARLISPAAGGGGVARPLVRGRALHASRRGRVAVTLTCPRGGGPCTGSVHLRARRQRIGARRFSVSAGRRATVAIRLTRAGRAMLRRTGHARVRVAARSTVSPARVVWTTRTTTLRGPRSRR